MQRTPNAPLANGFLTADSCTRRTACTAVGYYRNDAGVLVPLAERWNGTDWAVQAAPRPGGAAQSTLEGVSCTSATACTAVGYYTTSAGDIQPLAEAWNGTTWSIQPTHNPAGSPASGFFAVSCTSARACTAVGDYRDSLGAALTLAERWNGTKWAVQATHNPASAADSGLFGLSCTSATACTAVGNFDRAGVTRLLAESWNGTAWTLRRPPDPSGAAQSVLNGVSCTSASACIAVGDYTDSSGNTWTLAEQWNGTSWAIQPTTAPAGSQFAGVSCISASACTAVGAGANGALAQRWNGTRWMAQVTHSTSDSGLAGVSCATARSCIAAGYHKISTPDGNYTATLAEAWNGTRWRVRAAPSPVGATNNNDLLGVSCPVAAACTATGFSAPPGNSPPLVMRWNGTAWGMQRARSPSGGSNAELAGVSCTSARACTAVGDYLTSAGTTRTLAEVWNGSSWRIQPTPSPAASGYGSQLHGVWCTAASACTAVGSYAKGSGPVVAFAERWNGTTWIVQHAAPPGGATASRFTAVSCRSATTCTAVGYYDNSSSSQVTLAEAWNGSTWRVQPTPNPAGAGGYELDGVACTSASACTATGSYINSTGGQVTLAERWNGSTWRVQPTPNLTGAAANSLSAVSCASKNKCAAVGYYYDLGPSGMPLPPLSLAAAWNGTRWTLQNAPNPPGTTTSVLDGVSCTPARCTAVGYSYGLSAAQLTYALTRSPA